MTVSIMTVIGVSRWIEYLGVWNFDGTIYDNRYSTDVTQSVARGFFVYKAIFVQLLSFFYSVFILISNTILSNILKKQNDVDFVSITNVWRVFPTSIIMKSSPPKRSVEKFAVTVSTNNQITLYWWDTWTNLTDMSFESVNSNCFVEIVFCIYLTYSGFFERDRKRFINIFSCLDMVSRSHRQIIHSLIKVTTI